MKIQFSKTLTCEFDESDLAKAAKAVLPMNDSERDALLFTLLIVKVEKEAPGTFQSLITQQPASA